MAAETSDTPYPGAADARRFSLSRWVGYVALIALLFGIGGVAMAVTVAVLTGLGLRRMLAAGPPDSA